MEDYEGQAVLISGASSGIGLGLASVLSVRGARVAITGTSATKLAAAAETLRARGAIVLPLQFDVTDTQAWHNAAQRVDSELGPIRLLILNAGVAAGLSPLEATPAESWRLNWDVNVMGIVHGLQACLPAMKQHGLTGHIMMTSSIAGVRRIPGFGPYAVTKAAIVGMAELLRTELAGSALTASVMCPATVKTDLADSSIRHASLPDGAVVTQMRQMLAAGLDPEDVANFALDRIAAGSFYIFTHNMEEAHGESEITARYQEMKSAMKHWVR